MSGNGHAAYFGQAVAPKGEGTQNENNSSQSNIAGSANNSSQTIPTGTAGGQSTMPLAPGPAGQGPVLHTDS